MKHEITLILRSAQSVPWAILETKLAEIRHFLWSRANGVEISAEEKEAWLKKAEDRQRFTRAGSVAVIPVMGTISQRMNMLSAMSGGTSTEMLGREISTAAADPDISAIVLNVDSPGGTVPGLTELHSAIMSARERKPIVASVNSMSASAAYWITSAASEISITPSGEAGSIGVFAMHVDESAALEQEGVKVSLIHFGDRKIDGNRFQPLTEEARASIQADVDAFGAMFHRDVAKGRGVSVADVREKFGQGAMLLAKDALAAGLVDKIETLDQTITRLTRGTSKPGRKAEDLRIRTEMAGKFI